MALAVLAVVKGVAGRLVAAVADEDLVQGQKLLPVVEGGLNHCPLFNVYLLACSVVEQVCHVASVVAHEYSFILVGIRVDSQDWLTRQVLGHIGHQTILTSGDDEVFWLEEKAVQVAASNTCVTPLLGNGVENGVHRLLLQSVAVKNHRDVLPALTEEP